MKNLFTVLLILLLCRTVTSQERFEFQEYHMAVPVKMIIYAGDGESAQKASGAAFKRFEQLNKIMSDYDYESEVMRLCRENWSMEKHTQVSEDLYRVLLKSKEFCTQSNGAFDITVSPIVKLWRRAKRLRAMPEKELLEKAKALVGDSFWEIDTETKTVRILKEGIRFDLGGIAKGDAIDQAVLTLQEHGIQAGLVDAGGDLRVFGTPPHHNRTCEKSNRYGNRNGWIIDIPSHEGITGKIVANDLAAASSGDSEQHLIFDGKRYSHIIDPRTGMPMTDCGTVTVTAPDAVTADALASILSVLSPEEGLALLEKYPGTGAVITREQNGRQKTWVSPHWNDYFQTTEQ
jgi:thiamine biosynthesis lipoprotein